MKPSRRLDGTLATWSEVRWCRIRDNCRVCAVEALVVGDGIGLESAIARDLLTVVLYNADGRSRALNHLRQHHKERIGHDSSMQPSTPQR